MRVLLNKRNLLAIALATAAFLTTFYLVFAGAVQWSRAQPTQVYPVSVQELATSSVLIFEDADLTNELTENELLKFPVPQYQPPLDKVLPTVTHVTKYVFLYNATSSPDMSPLRISQQLRDDVTNEYYGNLDVIPDSTAPIQPGGSRRVRVSINNIRAGLIGRTITVAFGALGGSASAKSSGEMELSVRDLVEGIEKVSTLAAQEANQQ